MFLKKLLDIYHRGINRLTEDIVYGSIASVRELYDQRLITTQTFNFLLSNMIGDNCMISKGTEMCEVDVKPEYSVYRLASNRRIVIPFFDKIHPSFD